MVSAPVVRERIAAVVRGAAQATVELLADDYELDAHAYAEKRQIAEAIVEATMAVAVEDPTSEAARILALLDVGEPSAWMVEYLEMDGTWQTEDPPFYHEEDAINRAASYEPWDGEVCARVVPLYASPAPVEPEGERTWTADEIDAALYDAHREWDERNMASLSDLMLKNLRALHRGGDEDE